MGAIIDVLLLGKAGILQLQKQYPHAVVRNMSNSRELTQKYRVIIPGEELDDGYYDFLVDCSIALSSSNFRNRLESDVLFRQRMMARAAANQKKELETAAAKEGKEE